MIKFDIDREHSVIHVTGKGDIVASEVIMANLKLAELLAKILNMSVDSALLFMMQECARVYRECETHD